MVAIDKLKSWIDGCPAAEGISPEQARGLAQHLQACLAAEFAVPRGWQLNHVQHSPDEEGVCDVGVLSAEDGSFSPVVTVSTGEYLQPQDAKPLAEAIMKLTQADGLCRTKFVESPGQEGGCGGCHLVDVIPGLRLPEPVEPLPLESTK